MAVQKTPRRGLRPKDGEPPEGFDFVYTATGKRVLLPQKAGYPFTPQLAEYLVYQVTEGRTLRAICRDTGMPKIYQVRYWETTYPEFHRAMIQARKLRGEAFHDKAIEAAEEVGDPKEVQMAKLKAETYKWAAQTADPDAYSGKQQEGVKGGITINISTGVPQPKSVDVEVEDGGRVHNADPDERDGSAGTGKPDICVDGGDGHILSEGVQGGDSGESSTEGEGVDGSTDVSDTEHEA